MSAVPNNNKQFVNKALHRQRHLLYSILMWRAMTGFAASGVRYLMIQETTSLAIHGRNIRPGIWKTGRNVELTISFADTSQCLFPLGNEPLLWPLEQPH